MPLILPLLLQFSLSFLQQREQETAHANARVGQGGAVQRNLGEHYAKGCPALLGSLQRPKREAVLVPVCVNFPNALLVLQV